MEAMASFELGVYLVRQGETTGAQRHFDRARELAPDNWTFRRQAWSLAGTAQDAIVATIRDPAAPPFYPELELGD
jgi:Flp pilus assembly protein TadD